MSRLGGSLEPIERNQSSRSVAPDQNSAAVVVIARRPRRQNWSPIRAPPATPVLETACGFLWIRSIQERMAVPGLVGKRSIQARITRIILLAPSLPQNRRFTHGAGSGNEGRSGSGNCGHWGSRRRRGGRATLTTVYVPCPAPSHAAAIAAR